MSGKLAVDFGTSNTLFALWDEQRKESLPLHIPDYGAVSNQGTDQLSFIPSLIHYTEDNRRWIGQQVLERDLYQSRHTFRWMKRYINHRSPIHLDLHDRTITPSIAGLDFLSTLIAFAFEYIKDPDEEVGFSVPVESFEHYQNWLSQAAEKAGVRRYRFIDEPSAAALGYNTSIQPGHAYLIFDMGGGTMHASIVLVEDSPQQRSGRRCRVLGKSGRDIGGATIDQWLFQKVLRDHNFKDYDPEIREISNLLLVNCERAKEELSFSTQTEFTIPSPNLQIRVTRTEFEDLLDNNNLFSEINACIQSALASAKERGYDQDAIQSVLMVGGGSQIPSIQRGLRQIFGKERIQCSRPMDAVVRGTSAFIAGIDFFDHIQHDYAIRHVNPQSGQYEYRVVVTRGTTYPTPQPIAEFSIKATFDGQKQLGVMIFEIGQAQHAPDQAIELIFDPSGAARLMQISPDQNEERSQFCMNEDHPTFLVADPPAIKGQSRFSIEFYIDANKRLTLTARDLQTGKLLFNQYPVVKLI